MALIVKKTSRLIFSLSLCLFTNAFHFSYGQKRIHIVGDTFNHKVFFLGEIHNFNELPDFKFEFIKFLNANYDVSNIVMEIGSSAAHLYNRFLKNGDTTVFALHTVFSTGEQNKKFWSELKRWNDSLPIQRAIYIYGIDFERKEYLFVVKNVLEKNNSKTRLSVYLKSLPDSLYHKGASIKVKQKIDKDLKRLYFEEYDALKKILNVDDLSVLEHIFQNQVSEYKFKKRNKSLYDNLRKLNLEADRFLCILGDQHTTRDIKNSPFLKFIKSGQLLEKTTLVSMVCERCYTSSKFYPNRFFPIVGGTKEIRRNKELLRVVDLNYSDPNFYTLISQAELDKFLRHEENNRIKEFFIFFKDQPQQK